MEYRLTIHLGSGPVRHTLEEDALVVEHEKTGRSVRVPYAEIREINLRQELPGACTLRILPERGRTLTIPARHFVSAGRFEDRGGEYLAFLKTLHERLSEQNTSVRFTAGSNALFWLGVLFVAFGTLFAATLAYMLLLGAPPRRVLFAVAPVLLLVGAGFVQQGRARSYDPDAPPNGVLPRAP